MNELDRLVEQCAALAGIGDQYSDAFGHVSQSPLATRKALLEDFGFDMADAGAAQESLDRLRRLRHGPLPATVVCEAFAPAVIALRSGADGAPWDWHVIGETGERNSGRAVAQIEQGSLILRLPALEMGYFDLELTSAGVQHTCSVISAPRQAWQAECLYGGRRIWGVSAQLYGLRTGREMGIGDFSSLATLAAGAAPLGAAFVGINPCHAMFPADRGKYSPYSPSSRIFLDPIYLDVTAIEGFEGSQAQELLAGDEMRLALMDLRQTELVNYEAVWRHKLRLLESLWSHASHRDSAEFAAYRARMGEPLVLQAAFDALSDHFRAQGRMWAGDWPAEFRRTDSAAVRQFRHDHAERISFHAWLQYQCDRQLGEAARAARDAGMPIGLYRDLAVGVDRAGADAWAGAKDYALNSAIGAPPDPLAPQGQNWGLPAFNPITLEQTGLKAFRAPMASNMRHAGALRIDHAFQLRRLFLVPHGTPSIEGAYVDYPFEAMLAVLRIESVRARCALIAEDLGNAPEGFSEAIMASGLLSYRVVPFERWADGAFKLPHEYPERAIAVAGTHDLPTFAGWWAGLDIDLRTSLGIYDYGAAGKVREERQADKAQLEGAMRTCGLDPVTRHPDGSETAPIEEATAFLGMSHAALVAVQLEDAIGERDQANLPGVQDADYPNWRRRLSQPVASIVAADGPLDRLAHVLHRHGRAAVPSLTP